MSIPYLLRSRLIASRKAYPHLTRSSRAIFARPSNGASFATINSKSSSELCHVPLRIIIAGAGTVFVASIPRGSELTFMIGIAGLSTAISLGRRGHSVVVLESTNETRSVGAGLGLTPPTKQWYESENVLADGDPACYEAEGFEVRRWDTDEVITRAPFPPEKKMIPILHADLKSALISRAEEMDNVEIKFGCPVDDVETSSPEVALATGERIGGDLIIVADGVGSSLKWKVSPSELERAQPTGDAAYRLVLSRQLLEKDGELLALVQHPWAKRWDGPHGSVVAYPIHNFELLNLVLLHPDENAEESWNSTTQKHHVVADFREWNSTIRRLIDLAPDNVPNFRVLSHSPSSAWVKGSVMLLGDACHAMPPYLGQGVAQAVEDAIAITTVLSLIKSKNQLPEALQAYEMSRKSRVLEMQAATRQAQQFSYRKDSQPKAASNKEQEDAFEAKKSDDLIKVMRSSWAYDAAEAAQRALLTGLAKL